ncbi:MAG: tRNA uridine-5-carboxymethylaminomethyl(34) synthesis enzyme MnmG, partial [Candidatus Eisenbacteria sp.]|nr:tRNA uridine-5-carboxymethylaminomethyl(34) synthesis enzyme MnmG [Candidatus Eisenbacteria bacterium]
IAEPTELSTNVVVLTVGTFLQGKIFTGLDPRPGGRRGEPPAVGLTASLQRLGLQLGRLKTGTPPRLWKESIDFSRVTVQPGDEPPPRFSFYSEATVRNRVVCHFTRTNERTHEIIAGSLDRSPLYGGGLIRGIGPRYCPSIEDKVVRFPERRSHQIFLEPEGLDSDATYPAGIATSLPEDVQLAYVRTIPGLEQATFIHPGYAVEYDFLLTSQIDSKLGVRGIAGLFAAGQINGTSGYEEAAAQGIIAGLNAHALLAGREPVILARDQAYIGVLIDDLVTKVPTEPYRMFTSQSEYRLLLRQDNADRRLSHLGRQIGLLSRADWVRAERRWARIEAERRQLGSHRLNRERLRRFWQATDSPSLGDGDLGKTLEDLLKQPSVTMETLKALGHCTDLSELDEATVEAEVKYSGYIRKQEREVARARALENLRIPERILDAPPAALSNEALERLKEHRPRTLGQALRIPGVTPSDVFVLAVRIRSRARASTDLRDQGRCVQGAT